MQAVHEEFFDFLEERRQDCDVMWVSRSMKPLPPYILPASLVYSRKQAIEAVLADYNVKDAIHAVADARSIPVSNVVAEAKDILNVMASKSHLPTVRWLGLVVTKVLKRILISIRLNERFIYKLKDQMTLFPVQYVYAPTHRSYLDFILLSYILFSYDMALPNIASGMDFYRMRYVGELLRHTGAFYMRRRYSSDLLYKEIFKAYVSTLVANSDRALEFFIEGTRSRSQKTLAPKFGLLSTILENMYQSKVPDIQFIPISISYDKPLEELLFVYELLGVPKPEESTSGLFRSLSILREPFAHGHVYLKIAPPISIHDYLDADTRRASALDPRLRIPTEITNKVAYAIVDCHKRNTVLTAFNLISVLFNERIHTHPGEPYSIDDLLQNYCWLKNVFTKTFKATVNPPISKLSTTDQLDKTDKSDKLEDTEKQEVFDSLQTHKNLMDIDLDRKLKLINRHTRVTQVNKIKGHALREETLQIVVPVINMMIYVNPVFAYLSKPAIATLCIDLPSKEEAVKRYLMLRSLLSTEFALSTNISESELLDEWEEMSELIKDNITQQSSEKQLSNSSRLRSILCNLLMPYIASLYTLCKILSEWDNTVDCVENVIIKECQRHAEESLYQEDKGLIRHPYSLCLDTYVSLLSSLVLTGNVTRDKSEFYKPNRINLEKILNDLNDIIIIILKQCSTSVSLMNFKSAFICEDITNLRAKL